MRVDILTLFPEMVRSAASHSILGRAQAAGSLTVVVHDIRNHAINRYRTADDYPFGGGAGMVMKPEPLVGAIEAAIEDAPETPVILLAPDGEPFVQSIAQELSEVPRFVLVCGHYEGIDERVREGWVTRTLSLGDYVLTGGELAALVVLDAAARLVPGVLGNSASTGDESFTDGALEYPHYTRPAEFRGRRVPDILLSGHHAQVARWRRVQALVRTRERRPDLFEKLLPLGTADQKLLDAWDTEAALRAQRCVRVADPVSLPEPAPETTAGGCAETKTQQET
jgi:tRNA (guanine37-N1)-methyltransferase